MTGDYRIRGIQLASLFLIVSFAFIPVRCDVSAAPHSIFLAPDMLNHSNGHALHTAGKPERASAKSVPHHSPVAANTSGHQHGVTTENASSGHAERKSLALASGSDPKSQQPVGATLDLPTSSITADTVTLQPLDTRTQLVRFAPAAVLSGIDAPPETPPPQAA